MNPDGKREQVLQKIKPRRSRLCCLVNPFFRCRTCNGRVCYKCNDIDEEIAIDLDPDYDGEILNRIGHCSAECLILPDEDVAACWIRTDKNE